jgi:hypothetical protein
MSQLAAPSIIGNDSALVRDLVYAARDTDVDQLGTFPRHWKVNFKPTKGPSSQLSCALLRLRLCTVKFTSTQIATTA